ncbi:hypothetical protein PbJCM13498_33280 [Prolixibacter bellariivorans]|uniref:Uncharacterized protein n=1 Tax=Prolixibacter bellariivorans TaxID=314319 RepID=A0A5M4B2T5_9BACT|nr:hypothetical protein [Prolixibacter bellariivorans]GET34465.1 hypothetical protein PbJCM13498_33280 [Prolixibacter bellariivorans]
MEDFVDRSRIIGLLEDKIKYKALKLPSRIGIHIDNKVLYISLNAYQNPKGETVFPCTLNMQKDEAAFEGWGIVLKHHLDQYIDKVILSWDISGEIADSQRLHYNRFLYRVVRFSQLFSWFETDKLNGKELIDFEERFRELNVNTALNVASEVIKTSAGEKQIEYNQQNLEYIRKYFELEVVNHQLPVGVKQNGKGFFTGRASAIDIWGIDRQDNLNIFELKYGNKMVGIISELLFYSEVMYDLFISDQIGKPHKVKNIRDAEKLYQNERLKIRTVKSYFLFDEIHPLVVGVTALLNTNEFGIRFFNVQYKLKKDSFQFERLYYKGGFQMEEEIKQAAFRFNSKIKGYDYFLNKGEQNLHESIREQMVQYFQKNKIAWWTFNHSKHKPTTHLVSSQIQCLNFLFVIRKDKNAVLRLAQLFDSEIDEVYPAISDKDPGYIAFEFTYENGKLLNESDAGARRGEYCTSVDAFIIARRHGKKVLIPIEWKYTEHYLKGENKALELSKGETRQKRYNGLITSSRQLRTLPDLAKSVYYYEPFYELMRQTLLVERMVDKGVGDDFLHILIVSVRNRDLLGKNSVLADALPTRWTKCLSDSAKFKIVDSMLILELLENEPFYSELVGYLKLRY